MDASPIRVLIADDQHLIRGGLRAIIDAEPDLRVVAEAADGASAAREAVASRADVVLMDVQMPVVDGIEGVRLVGEARPEARVLMLTMFDLDDYVVRALRAGASGFLLKTTPPADLAAAIERAAAARCSSRPSVTRRLVESYVNQPARGRRAGAAGGLTARELDVFQAIAQGLSNMEIGHQLYMGEATVKTHVTRILAKLGLRDRVQAVVLAYDCGIMRPGSD